MSAQRFAGVAALVTAAMAMVVPVASAGTARFGAFPRVGTAQTAVGAATFGGLTSQDDPVVLMLAPPARVTQAVVALDMTCTSGASFVTVWGFHDLAITRNGRIKVTDSVFPQRGSTVSLTGGSESLTATLNPRRLTITGTWHLNLGFQMSNGQTDQCDSGNVTFTAHL